MSATSMGTASGLAGAEGDVPAGVRSQLARVFRYSAVSLVRTLGSLVILFVLVQYVDLAAGWANVISTLCGVGPAFELNRRWVWHKHGGLSWSSEVLPFCILSFAGLGLSTVAVHLANAHALHAGWSHADRTSLVEVANLSAFGVVWVAQYLILDRWVFRDV